MVNKYSLIKNRPKKLFRLDSQLWMGFLGLITTMYLVVQIIFLILEGSVESTTIDYVKRKEELDKKIYVIEENIKLVKSQEELGGRVVDRNAIIADSLSSLFSLIPDSIYLTEAKVYKNKLVLKGYTPSKEIYNYLLLPPLKSIFEETRTGFFPMDNGWFRFVSESYSEKESIYEKD